MASKAMEIAARAARTESTALPDRTKRSKEDDDDDDFDGGRPKEKKSKRNDPYGRRYTVEIARTFLKNPQETTWLKNKPWNAHASTRSGRELFGHASEVQNRVVHIIWICQFD
jgi:hypothetical protein